MVKQDKITNKQETCLPAACLTAVRAVRVIVSCILVILSFVSCSKPLYKNKFVIAGTYLEVISPNKEAAGIVYREFKRLDKIFNTYDPNSEISRLNRTYDTPFKASSDLIGVLKISQNVEALSKGAFDVSQGALYNFWKKLIEKGRIEQLPSQEVINELRELGGMDNIEIDSKQGTVKIKKKDLIIDLGAIAKGYIVDKAVLRLKERGIESALINAGGDIYCLGRNGNKFWRVGIKDPKRKGEIINSQSIFNGAVATSGDYEQFFYYQGKRYSHLIDPRRGYPVQNSIISVSVISKDCTTADSLATAFFIMGLPEIEKFMAKKPSAIRIFVVIEDEKGESSLHLIENYG